MKPIPVPLALFLLPLLLCPLSAQNLKPSSKAKPQTTTNSALKKHLGGTGQKVWAFPTCGFSLSLSPEWKLVPTLRGRDVMAGAQFGKTGGIRHTLLVQMGPSPQPTLPEHARIVAERSQGKVSKERLDWQGTPAFLIKQPDVPSLLPQRVALVFAQAKQIFTLSFTAAAGENMDALIKNARKGWRWRPFAPPIEHLEFRRAAVPIFDGRFTISLPEIMRQVPSSDTGPMFAVFDARTGVAAMTVIVNVVPVGRPLKLREMRDQFGRTLQQQLNLPQASVWHDKPGNPPRTICEPFQLPAAMGERGYTSFTSYGLIKFSDTEWLLLTFTMTGQSDRERKSYQPAIDKIFASLKSTLP